MNELIPGAFYSVSGERDYLNRETCTEFPRAMYVGIETIRNPPYGNRWYVFLNPHSTDGIFERVRVPCRSTQVDLDDLSVSSKLIVSKVLIFDRNVPDCVLEPKRDLQVHRFLKKARGLSFEEPMKRRLAKLIAA